MESSPNRVVFWIGGQTIAEANVWGAYKPEELWKEVPRKVRDRFPNPQFESRLGAQFENFLRVEVIPVESGGR